MYKLRKGDLIISDHNVGVVVKTTRKYIYYISNSREGRISKQRLWSYLDTKHHVNVRYGEMSRRRKQKSMRTLDLHGTIHEKADEKVRKFLNFVDLPCTIVTGKSTRMRSIVESVVRQYGWSVKTDPSNQGVLTIVEGQK